VDYIFLTRERFEGMIERGELLEWAEVHGNLYGVPRAQVAGALDDGRDVIIKPDVQGAATIRSLVPDAVSIFLAPPSDDELRRRLEERLTETPEVLKRRLKTAKVEMGEASKFDHVVINHNGRLDQAVDDVDEIVARERRRRSRPVPPVPEAHPADRRPPQ
jgi:guanylate kinase